MILNKMTIAVTGLMLFAQSSVHASSVLFSETFDGVFGSTTCSAGHGHGTGDHCSQYRQQYGVPTIATGADEDWWGARFETPDNGTVPQDVGVVGTTSNAFGLVEDDAGLLFRLDTRGYSDITLSFDWRTFKTYSGDRFVAGYYVGDLAVDAGGFDSYRSIDLRGSSDPWNWNSTNSNWNELLRGRNDYAWNAETFSLSLAADQADVWVALWLDNGENDYGKLDNIYVTGTAVVPLPAAVWLFASGLYGLSLVGRRRTS